MGVIHDAEYVKVIQCFGLVMEYISLYFITNKTIEQTYLALTLLFPVLLTQSFHIVKYTYYVVFCCISFRSMSFPF